MLAFLICGLNGILLLVNDVFKFKYGVNLDLCFVCIEKYFKIADANSCMVFFDLYAVFISYQSLKRHAVSFIIPRLQNHIKISFFILSILFSNSNIQ